MPEMSVRWALDTVKDAKLTIGVGAALWVGNLVAGDELTVYGSDSLKRQAALALPSAVAVPAVTGNPALDCAIQISTAAISLEAARRTTSLRTLAGMALAAQVVSCAADAAVERSGWLTPVERAQPDVGFSAISMAWFTKFLLDRSVMAKTPSRSRLWKVGAAVFVGAMSVGSYLVEGSQGGKIDMVAHGSAAAVGVSAHLLSRPKANSD